MGVLKRLQTDGLKSSRVHDRQIGSESVIPLGQDTLDKIKEYLEARPEKSDYLMPLTRRSIYNIVKMAAEKAGLSGKVILNPETGKRHFIHPHSFRDALADRLGLPPLRRAIRKTSRARRSKPS